MRDILEVGLISRMEQLLTDAELGIQSQHDFYCGSDTRAEFLVDVLFILGYETETYTIDGEYWVKVYKSNIGQGE